MLRFWYFQLLILYHFHIRIAILLNEKRFIAGAKKINPTGWECEKKIGGNQMAAIERKPYMDRIDRLKQRVLKTKPEKMDAQAAAAMDEARNNLENVLNN